MLSVLLWLVAAPVSTALAADATPAQPERQARAPTNLSTPNLYRTPDGCESIPRQVAGEDRKYPGTRLDRLPPGKLLHAVERRVDGCPVVTFVAEERRRQLQAGR